MSVLTNYSSFPVLNDLARSAHLLRRYMTQEDKWEQILVEQGLGLNVGHNPHVVNYGYSTAELDDKAFEARSIPKASFQAQVELRLAEGSGNENAALRMKTLRARRSEAKRKLKEKIWSR